MDLKVEYKNVSSKDDAYAKVKEAITPEMLAKFQVKADLNYNDGQNITASGKGFDMDFAFTDSSVEVSLKLSFLLKAFKGKILEGVEKQLNRIV